MSGRNHHCRHRSGKHLHRQIEVPELELDLESSERIIIAADKHDNRGPGPVSGVAMAPVTLRKSRFRVDRYIIGSVAASDNAPTTRIQSISCFISSRNYLTISTSPFTGLTERTRSFQLFLTVRMESDTPSGNCACNASSCPSGRLMPPVFE